MTFASYRLARRFGLLGLTLALSLGAGGLAARADDAPPGVARISVLQGRVDVKRADSGDTVAAVLNAPLNVGDYLTTQHDARSEVQLGSRTSLRIAPDTQLRFTDLGTSANVLQLAAGTVALRLFGGDAAHPEVDTPDAALRPERSGRYRISVDPDGNTFVTVRSGAAQLVTQDATQTLRPGSTVEVSGDRASAQIQTVAEVQRDAFDSWNDERDRFENDAAGYAYLDPGIVGGDDLYQYGSWIDDSTYGEVWHPAYAPGWSPYQVGQWAWEPYYGWTWVSAEPWGWAPYHYGRWFYAAGPGWCWYPGVAYATPIYQPALVAFFSFGGISFGFGPANIGWVPLAPFEPFHPWWGLGYGGAAVFDNVTTTSRT